MIYADLWDKIRHHDFHRYALINVWFSEEVQWSGVKKKRKEFTLKIVYLPREKEGLRRDLVNYWFDKYLKRGMRTWENFLIN